MIDPQPIHDQFIVLERRMPELRTTPEDGEGSAPKKLWRSIPLWIRMIILLFVMCSLITFPTLIAYVGERATLKEYSLSEYVKWEDTNPWLEVVRWSIVLEISIGGLIITFYTSIFVPQIAAYFVKRSRKLLTVTIISHLETICTIWRYLSYTALSATLWILSLYIFYYPSELIKASHKSGSYIWSELPFQFGIERFFLLIFISSILLAMEKLILHRLTKEFNQPLYRERIQKSLYALWTVAVLKKAATLFNYSHISNHRGNFEKLWEAEDYPYSSQDLMSIFILEQFVKLGKKSGERKQTMAKRLFHFLISPDNNELFIEDIRPFFTKVEVEKAFSILDAVRAGDVSEKEFIKAIDDIYQERANLIAVLLTNSDVIGRLNKFMLTFMGILIFFTLFPIIGFSPAKVLIPLGVSITPTIVACTLIFGETIKSIFASIIFLFATHPYDVGDRIYMDQGNYFVREIGLLSTMFERWDGSIVYIPNSVLATKAVCNVRRTGLQSQRIEISLPAYIPTTSLYELESKLTQFIQAEARDFAAIRSCCYEMRDLNQIVMIIALKHRSNWQDGYLRSIRNNKFLGFLAQTINEMGIQYYSTIRSCELIPPKEIDNK